MTDTLEHVSGLLHEASETHHRVFRIVDGADPRGCRDRGGWRPARPGWGDGESGSAGLALVTWRAG